MRLLDNFYLFVVALRAGSVQSSTMTGRSTGRSFCLMEKMRLVGIRTRLVTYLNSCTINSGWGYFQNEGKSRGQRFEAWVFHLNKVSCLAKRKDKDLFPNENPAMPQNSNSAIVLKWKSDLFLSLSKSPTFYHSREVHSGSTLASSTPCA